MTRAPLYGAFLWGFSMGFFYGAPPHAPPIFFEKKIGSKSFTPKMHTHF